MNLGGLFGGGARAGVIGVNDLTQAASQLINAGVPAKDIPRILPLAFGGGAAGAAASAGGVGQTVSNVLGGLGTAIAGEVAANRLLGQSYVPAKGEPTGRGFLTTTDEQRAIYEYVARENFQRSALNKIGYNLPMLDAEELISQASSLKAGELQKATERSIQEKKVERGFDVQIAEIARQAEIEKQRLASEAAVAAQREQSLGDIQRQRVESSYATARDLLNQTIKDVVARERYENNTTLAELARAI